MPNCGKKESRKCGALIWAKGTNFLCMCCNRLRVNGPTISNSFRWDNASWFLRTVCCFSHSAFYFLSTSSLRFCCSYSYSSCFLFFWRSFSWSSCYFFSSSFCFFSCSCLNYVIIYMLVFFFMNARMRLGWNLSFRARAYWKKLWFPPVCRKLLYLLYLMVTCDHLLYNVCARVCAWVGGDTRFKKKKTRCVLMHFYNFNYFCLICSCVSFLFWALISISFSLSCFSCFLFLAALEETCAVSSCCRLWGGAYS